MFISNAPCECLICAVFSAIPVGDCLLSEYECGSYYLESMSPFTVVFSHDVLKTSTMRERKTRHLRCVTIFQNEESRTKVQLTFMKKQVAILLIYSEIMTTMTTLDITYRK